MQRFRPIAGLAGVFVVGTLATFWLARPDAWIAPRLDAPISPRIDASNAPRQVAPTSAAPRVAAPLESVLIQDVPHVRQKPDFCGEACAAMYLDRLGKNFDQDAVFDRSGLDPALGRGCYTRELSTALRNIGFRIGQVGYHVDAAQAKDEMQSQFRALHKDLVGGVPSIICMHYDARPGTTEHFRLILGYDKKTDEVIYHEPAVDRGAYRRMKREELLRLWPLKYDPKKWTVIRMRLEPGALQKAPRAEGFTDADYAQHVMQLKKKLPSAAFYIHIQKPFVVVGDESPEKVRRRASGTIHWATVRLKKDYFAKDPERILDIWLFKDKDSYEKHAQEVFGDKPTTPYGYYSSRHGALVMNIETGGGTLVHEIVHPFMAANFPKCPSWFNEGLASLYEQSGDRDGHIIGRTNWRLRGLQLAIGRDTVPSFETLCGTTSREFYNEDPGTNYSQARYLCYYLQERGLLVKYYRQFLDAAGEDPGGYRTLQRLLGERDMAAFKKRWEQYVLKLRF